MRLLQDILLRWGILLILFLVPSSILYSILLKGTFYGLFLSLDSIGYAPINLFPSIRIENELLTLIPACIALSAYYLFFILSLTSGGAPFRRLLALILSGIILLFFGNLARLVLLAYILLEFGIPFFEQLHLLIWGIGSTIYVVMVWFFLAWHFRIKKIPIYSDFVKVYRSSWRKIS